MPTPNYQEVKALHQKYAPSLEVFESVFTHCLIVQEIATQLITSANLDIDANLVISGCWLHDIGVHAVLDAEGASRPDAHYITHGVAGERILREEGFSENLCRFASHHTGVGLTVTDIERQGLPLPANNYLAETDEELLVMYADKFHSKTTPAYFNTYDWYENYVARFGDEKTEIFREMAQRFGKPNLKPLSAKYGQAIRTA